MSLKATLKVNITVEKFSIKLNMLTLNTSYNHIIPALDKNHSVFLELYSSKPVVCVPFGGTKH